MIKIRPQEACCQHHVKYNSRWVKNNGLAKITPPKEMCWRQIQEHPGLGQKRSEENLRYRKLSPKILDDVASIVTTQRGIVEQCLCFLQSCCWCTHGTHRVAAAIMASLATACNAITTTCTPSATAGLAVHAANARSGVV